MTRCSLEGLIFFFLDKFNLLKIVREPIECGRLSSSQFYKTSSLKLTSFPKESVRCFNLLSLRSSSSNCVNDPMLSGRVDIFFLDKFNLLKIVREPIECGRLSSSQFCKTSSLKLTSFPKESVRCFNLLLLRSSSSNCVNDQMLFGRVDIFVLDKFNFFNIVRKPIESGRLSSSQFCKLSTLKLTSFPKESIRCFN